MIPADVALVIRTIDGEKWASYHGEHAAADDEKDAALALWEQLGQYLDSLSDDESDLSPILMAELQRIRSIMRHR
jgi:hypothetical protein